MERIKSTKRGQGPTDFNDHIFNPTPSYLHKTGIEQYNKAVMWKSLFVELNKGSLPSVTRETNPNEQGLSNATRVY